MKTKALLLFMLTAFTMGATAKDYTVASPDGKLVITIHADQQRLTWEVQHGKTTVLAPSEIGLNGAFQKMNGKVTKHTAVVSNKQFSVEFRADNDAAAYRIHVSDKKGITVNNETAEFNFAADYNAFIPYVNDNRGGERRVILRRAAPVKDVQGLVGHQSPCSTSARGQTGCYS